MKRNKIMALIVAICLIVGSVNFYIFDVWDRINGNYAIQTQDRALAEDLASMTGKTADSLLKLKSENGSWNSTIDNLDMVSGDEKMTDVELQNLIASGEFTEDEINEAKSAVETVAFNLEEIQRNTSFTAEPTTSDFTSASNDKTAQYGKIAQNFDKNLAIYLVLKLKTNLGSIQAVIDEYLYCLQIEVDLQLLLVSEDEYEKAVLEKSFKLMREDAITSDDISSRMLESLQPKSQHDADAKKADKPNASTTTANPVTVADNLKPQDPRPKDPTREVMDEIDKINQSWMNRR